MALHPKIERALQHGADQFYARWPRKNCSAQRLAGCRIISHRGEHDNRRVLENSLEAFDLARKAGVWGIEFDIRWTADGVPVVFHDANLKRLFGVRRRIDQMPWKVLEKRFPSIPSLAAVIQRYGKRLHLMVEIKRPPESSQRHALQRLLAPLEPVSDFHLMALSSVVLNPMKQVMPRKALVGVANYMPARFSKWVLQQQWGGLCAHYLLMPSATIRKHKRYGQSIGTGYAASRNALLREINRGVDWIFSNKAAAMQACLEAEKSRIQRP